MGRITCCQKNNPVVYTCPTNLSTSKYVVKGGQREGEGIRRVSRREGRREKGDGAGRVSRRGGEYSSNVLLVFDVSPFLSLTQTAAHTQAQRRS